MSTEFTGPDAATLTVIAVNGFTSGLKEGFTKNADPDRGAPTTMLRPAYAYANMPKQERRRLAQERDLIERVSSNSFRAGVNCAATIKRAFGFY